jgi:hypothetical protein
LYQENKSAVNPEQIKLPFSFVRVRILPLFFKIVFFFLKSNNLVYTYPYNAYVLLSHSISAGKKRFRSSVMSEMMQFSYKDHWKEEEIILERVRNISSV